LRSLYMTKRTRIAAKSVEKKRLTQSAFMAALVAAKMAKASRLTSTMMPTALFNFFFILECLVPGQVDGGFDDALLAWDIVILQFGQRNHCVESCYSLHGSPEIVKGLVGYRGG